MAPAAASSLLAPVLGSPVSHLTVLGRSDGLVWLSLDGQAVTIQRLAADSPQALPTSLFLAPPLTEIERSLNLRNGRLHLAEDEIHIHRWWQPRRAKQVETAPWRGASRNRPPVQQLLGRGLGLTPEGDDLLAGWLVAARSLRHQQFETVRDQVLAAAPTRTSTFSAALLLHAAEGYGVAPLIEYVDALARSAHPIDDSIDVTRAALIGVGHTSGKALAVGVEWAFGLETATRERVTGNQERVSA